MNMVYFKNYDLHRNFFWTTIGLWFHIYVVYG